MILLTHECVIAKEQKRNDDKQAKVERKKMQKIQAAPLPKVWNSEEEDEVEVDEDPTAKGLEMVYIPVPTRSRPNSCKKKIQFSVKMSRNIADLGKSGKKLNWG